MPTPPQGVTYPPRKNDMHPTFLRAPADFQATTAPSTAARPTVAARREPEASGLPLAEIRRIVLDIIG